MATMVGTQRNLVKLLNSLIELDLDAVAAYRAAIERLENTADKNQMGAFMEDHERHITELTQVVESWGEDAAENVDLKAVLTQGKVVIGALFGDRAILMAMKTNEDDTNTRESGSARRRATDFSSQSRRRAPSSCLYRAASRPRGDRSLDLPSLTQPFEA